MNNLKKIIEYGCVLLIAWPICFLLKATLLWVIWNLTYDFIPIINEPISWLGSLCICLLIQILYMGLNINFQNKK